MRIGPHNAGIVHFIGIGGIGMSGIAEVLFSLGYAVQGSDIVENSNVQRLKGLGISVFIGHNPAHVNDVGVVVISTDIKQTNVELVAARLRGLPIVHRAEMLAELMRLKPSIAVSGTHGKTTTTSLTAALLDGAGQDPTVVSGGIINAYGTNARLGRGDWIVVEADESDGSFMRLPATVAIVTNIDAEHMDYYGDYEALWGVFLRFVENIPFYGLGVLCADHPAVSRLAAVVTDRRLVTYGFDEIADVRAINVRPGPGGMTFDVVFSDRFFRVIKNSAVPHIMSDCFLPMFGEHNVQNALGALTAAFEVGVDPVLALGGLARFQGVGRRFTKVGSPHGITIIDDYAHHPKEIEVVLKAGKSAAGQGRIIAVVQPHRYSRLSHLYSDFCDVLLGADHVIVTPIYGAGEDPIPGLTHEKLAVDLKMTHGGGIHTADSVDDLAKILSNIGQAGDYVICMGAGNITQWAEKLPMAMESMDQ